MFRTVLAGTGIVVAAYAGFAAMTWLRYGEDPHAAPDDERDVLLDRFMPLYEVVERHHVRVAAPADVTLAAAKEQDVFRLGLVRAIVRTREIVLGATPDAIARPGGLLAQTLSLGWAVLAEG
jgi:hypothetical protein